MSHFVEMDMIAPSVELYDQWCQIKKEYGFGDGQISVTNVVGHEDDPYYGTGSLYYDWDNKVTNPDGSHTVPKFETPIKEEDFTSISTIFRGTGFEQAVETARKNFRTIGRGRIMTLMPQKCLSWHHDTEPRLHLPLRTNEKCFMVIGDEVKHLNAGRWWHTNTVVPHTVFNGSNEPRTHLVFSIVQGE